MNGIINLIKPPGISSHQVVRHVRKLLNTRRVGHTGTLDPGAAGVLPLCVGPATRIAQYLVDHDKTYTAEMTLGLATKTQDAGGATTDMDLNLRISPDVLGKTFSTFLGEVKQIPPMSSAVHHQGKRLYQLDQQGITVERQPRTVFLKELHVSKIWPEKEYLEFGSQVLFSVRCSKGTYIRTLCEDIGAALNTFAHMSFLVRTASGIFTITDAITLEELESSIARHDYSFFTSIAQALPDFPQATLSQAAIDRVTHGNPISLDDCLDFSQQPILGSKVLLFGNKSHLLAIAEIRNNDGGLYCQPISVLGGEVAQA